MLIQSIQRAVSLLRLFGLNQPSLSLSDLSRMSGLPKSTVQGLANSLVQEGMLIQEPDSRRYSLGLSLHELGSLAVSNLPLQRVTRSAAVHLAEKAKLICRIAVWDRGGTLVLFSVLPRADAPYEHQLGPRIPSFCTALGRILLAFGPIQRKDEHLAQTTLRPYTPHTIINLTELDAVFKQTLQDGYTLCRQEMVMGRGALAAPLWGSEGKLAGAIALSGDIMRMENDTNYLASMLMEISTDISTSLGYTKLNARY